MDGEKGIEDLRVLLAGILIFNKLHQCPDGGFTCVVGDRRSTAQALTKTLAELELVFRGQAGMVEAVVAVGIEKAVCNDGRSELHRSAEKGLQSAAGPGIAAGLDDVGHAEGWVKTARPASKLSARGQEIICEEIGCFVIEAKRGGSEGGKERNDTLLHAEALGRSPWHAPGFALDGAQTLVIGLFAPLLLTRGETGQRWKNGQRAANPDFDGLIHL